MSKVNPTGTYLDVDRFGGNMLAVRSVVGGAFMGLANLMPGISGGTMLLAVGLYPQFISGLAEISTFRFRPKVMLMLACVVGAALVVVAGLARLIATLLDQHQWVMYSLFIGLTLGGIPLLWRRLHMFDRVVVSSATFAIVAMVLLAVFDSEHIGSDAASRDISYAALAVAGFAGGAAMILPGLSGAYLLLILGQYRSIVDAIALGTNGVRVGEWALTLQSLHVLVPVAVGVMVGVVSVSRVVTMLLVKYQRATLGFLLGLLLGAVIGLWPFTEPVAPQVGDVIRGVELTLPSMVAAVDPGDYRRVFVIPSLWQVSAGSLLVLLGVGVSWGISSFDRVDFGERLSGR